MINAIKSLCDIAIPCNRNPCNLKASWSTISIDPENICEFFGGMEILQNYNCFHFRGFIQVLTFQHVPKFAFVSHAIVSLCRQPRFAGSFGADKSQLRGACSRNGLVAQAHLQFAYVFCSASCPFPR